MAIVEPETRDPETTVSPSFCGDVDQLEADLITWAGHIAAATAQWLVWLAAYDRTQGWERGGCKSAAHWLSWKCGMSIGTARTHVRVARALEDLPVVAAAFAAGELSFSKVRALSRLRGPFDEAELVEQAKWATASQLDRIVGGCLTATRKPEPKRRYRSRADPNGTTEITITVAADEADRIEQTISTEMDRVIDERDESVSRAEWITQLGGWDNLRADTATALLTHSLTEPDPAPVEVVVNIEAGPAFEGRTATSGTYLPDEVTKKLSCEAAIATTDLVANTDGAIGIGRRTRIVPRWLRQLLERRDDHTCRFPSCTSNRRLHAHHIVHWSDHGPTNLDNLILLCNYHHHLVHEGGYSLTGSGQNPTFATPEHHELLAIPLVGSPRPVRGLGNAEQSLVAKWSGERLDLPYAVSVNLDAMSAYQRQPEEPGSPSLN